MRRPVSKERHLTQQERWQWQQANKDTVLFREEEAVHLPRSETSKTKPANKATSILVQDKPRAVHTLPPLRVGDFAGVDKRMAQRFSCGQMPLDRVIDLHGLNKIDAFGQVRQQLEVAYYRSDRCVLIITGKGRRQESVLRSSFPHWVNDPLMRPMILAVAQAKGKDGGEGAFYVLLRKNKDR